MPTVTQIQVRSLHLKTEQNMRARIQHVIAYSVHKNEDITHTI